VQRVWLGCADGACVAKCELRAERADGADGTRMVLVCGVCVCSFVRVVRVRRVSVCVKRRPVDSISGALETRLLLNPDLFRDGMLNPDLTSPG
jgi:hypothetical protein